MAMDITLKLDPIKGESVNDGHKDEIDVLAWSWGASNSATMHISSGGGSGKANVQDISITKYLDKSTCDLAKSCISGKHIDEAVLTVRKSGGDKPVDYLIIKLKKVFVSSIQTGGSGHDDRLTETISLNFGEVAMEYKLQDEKGSEKTGGKMAWNVATNKAA